MDKKMSPIVSGFFVIAIVVFSFLWISQIWETPNNTTLEKISASIVGFLICAVILALSVWKQGPRKFFGVVATMLLLASGAVALLAQVGITFPLEVVHETTYAQAPSSIEDPALKQYETQKMGFDEDWIEGGLAWTGLFFAFAFAVANIINIEARKHHFVFLYLPIQVVQFIIGTIAIAQFIMPSFAPDQATAEAENQAFWVGALMPFIWSLGMTILLWVRSKSTEIGNDIGGWLPTILTCLWYPVFASIGLIGMDMVVRIGLMSPALVDTAITMQRWTELELAGKFFGMFAPPAIKFTINLVTSIVRRQFDF